MSLGKYVDVVAWGCVPIEVKSSNLNQLAQYHFSFSVRQQQLGTNHLIAFITMEKDVPQDIYILPSHHPAFFNPRTQKRKMGIAWTPGGTTKNTNGVTLSDAIMARHKNNWQSIEVERQRVISQIENGTYVNWFKSA